MSTFRSNRASAFRFPVQRRTTGRSVLQRQCACGSRSEGGESCSECAEKEKDRTLQRRSSTAGTSEVPSIVYGVLDSPGQPLVDESRSFMEARFGYDFSSVRVHSDPDAQRSADATNAEAYTVGHDIVFASGRYRPETTEGQQLLAHELAHVVQQDGASANSGHITMGKTDEHEHEADSIASDIASGPTGEQPGTSTANTQLQAKDNEDSKSASTGTPAKAGAAPCIEEVVGEDIASLLQSGVVTIIEFGAPWCEGCNQNKDSLEVICERFKKDPPPVPVRIYSINTDLPENEGPSKEYVGAKIPELYFYVGSTLRARYNQGLQPDSMEYIVKDEVEYASTAGWWRGAKKGGKWGGLIGGAAGLIGGIAVASKANLDNPMLGFLGVLGAGVVGGALLAGGIGAIAGAIGDDRKTGPKDQKRKKFQPKLRNQIETEKEEREADQWAMLAGNRDSSNRGRPLDQGTKSFMEERFEHDFGHVRIHRDEHAEALTRELNAFAVTQGSDISFATDGYQPNTVNGRAVMAHELAHVVQNDNSAGNAPTIALESEAESAADSVMSGKQPAIQHGSSQPALAITRGEKTAAGAALGGAIGGAAGGLLGLGIASKMSGTPFLSGLAIGGLVGMGVGALVGGLIGFFTRRHESESVAEAEELIRRKYGKYIPNAKMGPLHNASVHVVTKEELCERKRCRSPEADCNLIGWTDTGVPMKPSKGPADQPEPIAKPEDEPTCNNKQMEHATVDHPVIYYVKNDETAGTLIHEGLHAHSHPSFGYLHNHVVEGTTEYFSRKLQDEINMPHYGSYNDEVQSVEKLVALVGEERLAQGYFTGLMPELHQAANSQLGQCALITWAFNLQMGSEARAQQIMELRNQNYCTSNELHTVSPADLTPAAPSRDQTQQTVEQK